MAETCPNDITTPVTVNEKRWKQGEINPETGLVFWQYWRLAKNGEYWVSPERFQHFKRNKPEKDKAYRESRLRELKEKKRQKYLLNRESILAKCREYRERNSEAVKIRQRDFQKRNKTVRNRNTKARLERDPVFAMAVRVRIRLCQAIKAKGYTKRSANTKLLGCSWAEFSAHIEKQFTKGMNWENRHLWHLDHIIPLSSASNIEDLERLCHFSNIQPLWAEDNMAKNDKMPDEFSVDSSLRFE